MQKGKAISDGVLDERMKALAPNKCCVLIYTVSILPLCFGPALLSCTILSFSVVRFCLRLSVTTLSMFQLPLFI